ncbi:MAG: hypothetical protein ACRCS3_08815, partial [Paracoccaceae bacterium]
TFVPALLAIEPGKDTANYLAGIDPLQLRWSDVVARIIAANPGAKLTIWCDEDTPLIWPEVLQAVAGVGPETALEGSYDVLEMIMSPVGVRRLKSYIDTKGPFSVERRRRAVAAFLDKFAAAEAIDFAFELPDWTAEMVAQMTDSYEADCTTIAAMPEVTFILP